MANVVFVCHDFYGLIEGDKHNFVPFYDAILSGLVENGNNVLCYCRPIVQTRYDFSIPVPASVLQELKEFKPDLFIFINNQFWDISEYFDCEILIYDVDSPLIFGNLPLLKRKTERFKFVSQGVSGLEAIMQAINPPKNNAQIIYPFTHIQSQNLPKDKNITFLGGQWIYNGIPELVEFVKSNPNEEDLQTAQKIVSEILKDISNTDYAELLKRLNITSSKLQIKDLFIFMHRLSGIERAKYLTELAPLGLRIYGNYWANNAMAFFPELALCYNSQKVVTTPDVSELYNTSKIIFTKSHLQAQNSFGWKIPETMASSAVLIVNKNSELERFTQNKLPTYTSKSEARELCERILQNENWRQELVCVSNEIVNQHFRPNLAFEKISQLCGVKLCNANAKKGRLIVKNMILTPAKPTQPLPQKPTQNRQAASVARVSPAVFDKCYVKICGINFCKIKDYTPNYKVFSMFGLPFLVIQRQNYVLRVNLWVVEKAKAALKRFFAKKPTAKPIAPAVASKPQPVKSNSNLTTSVTLKTPKQQHIQRLQTALQTNKPIKICLTVIRMWVFDSLYQLLKSDKRFEVVVCILPEKNCMQKNRVEFFNRLAELLKKKNIPFVACYDAVNDKSLEFKNRVNPDIVFYTDFWKPHFYDEFYITNFLDKMTLLCDYGFSVKQEEKTANFELNNLVDIYFRPTLLHKQMDEKLMTNKAINCVVGGSTKLDGMSDKSLVKPRTNSKKRVIIAFHHGAANPKEMYCNDAIFYVSEFMLQIAKRFKNKIEFIFRPHPLLKNFLYTRKEWGEAKTREYYAKWGKLNNCKLNEEDEFLELFANSDAMLTDCCSFFAEFTAFNKPLFHLVTPTSRDGFNEFGEELYKVCYKPKSKEAGALQEGIVEFLDNVVLAGDDYLAAQRGAFVQKYFNNDKTSAQIMLDEIVKFIKEAKC